MICQVVLDFFIFAVPCCIRFGTPPPFVIPIIPTFQLVNVGITPFRRLIKQYKIKMVKAMCFHFNTGSSEMCEYEQSGCSYLLSEYSPKIRNIRLTERIFCV